ncbi:MAG: acetyl-CoA carboxylase biotin carboxyl carrier protein subunit [Oscillospiraceae bacterium]|nr:acetyl-CoA carboxylase biotin carboxyl carrier protein subunit [Oscillospiraceae bacterium]
MKKYNVTVNGITYEVEIEESGVAASAPAASVATPASVPAPAPAAAPAPAPEAAPAPAPAGTKGSISVLAPMNGTILAVKVNPGDSVKKGDAVVILESMKMENDIPAPEDGVVASVEVKKGDVVNADAVLVTLA